jgi:large subunit ribosomal protein L21
VRAGNPTVAGAKVTAQVLEQGRGPKAVIFKYKAKVRYRRRTGHRQPFTRLSIEEIVAPGAESETKKPRRSQRRRKEESEG